MIIFVIKKNSSEDITSAKIRDVSAVYENYKSKTKNIHFCFLHKMLKYKIMSFSKETFVTA